MTSLDKLLHVIFLISDGVVCVLWQAGACHCPAMTSLDKLLHVIFLISDDGVVCVVVGGRLSLSSDDVT